MEILSTATIKVKQTATDWQESIIKTGSILLDLGYIEPIYIENMIEAVNTLGPYMVILPGFALVHAQPGCGVNKTSMSLLTLENPVYFGAKNDPVSVLLCLACEDKTLHIEMVQNIAVALMNDGIIERLSNCETEQEAFDCLLIKDNEKKGGDSL